MTKDHDDRVRGRAEIDEGAATQDGINWRPNGKAFVALHGDNADNSADIRLTCLQIAAEFGSCGGAVQVLENARQMAAFVLDGALSVTGEPLDGFAPKHTYDHRDFTKVRIHGAEEIREAVANGTAGSFIVPGVIKPDPDDDTSAFQTAVDSGRGGVFPRDFVDLPEVGRAANDALGGGAVDVLRQLFLNGPCWDGNLISKAGRDELIKAGFATKYDGWQTLTHAGMMAAMARDYDETKERRDRTNASLADLGGAAGNPLNSENLENAAANLDARGEHNFARLIRRAREALFNREPDAVIALTSDWPGWDEIAAKHLHELENLLASGNRSPVIREAVRWALRKIDTLTTAMMGGGSLPSDETIMGLKELRHYCDTALRAVHAPIDVKRCAALDEALEFLCGVRKAGGTIRPAIGTVLAVTGRGPHACEIGEVAEVLGVATLISELPIKARESVTLLRDPRGMWWVQPTYEVDDGRYKGIAGAG